MNQDRRFSWLGAGGQPKAGWQLHKRRPAKLTVCIAKFSTQEAIPKELPGSRKRVINLKNK
ncbi:hypothetical protein BBI15_14100 [Planococcus plakortidis]|uniref:Uncharacterized protein n=1 Tax=Planococcus plakortidis TaxID=1038856 RepID=A0A1C7EBX0_9BACL|nr:hypothetical protein BBI15_14100 [Planococcus plakortidis]